MLFAVKSIAMRIVDQFKREQTFEDYGEFYGKIWVMRSIRRKKQKLLKICVLHADQRKPQCTYITARHRKPKMNISCILVSTGKSNHEFVYDIVHNQKMKQQHSGWSHWNEKRGHLQQIAAASVKQHKNINETLYQTPTTSLETDAFICTGNTRNQIN